MTSAAYIMILDINNSHWAGDRGRQPSLYRWPIIRGHESEMGTAMVVGGQV